MKFKFIVIFFFFSICTFGRKVDDGETLLNNKQFAKARVVYQALLKQKPNDVLYNFRYARCCYELKDFETAIVHFQLSGNKFPQRELYLGELYFATYRFDESITAYQNYIITLKPDDTKLPEYEHKLKQAENALRMLSKIDDIGIVDSVVVSKSEFLKFYKYNSELGLLKQEQIKLIGRKTTDKIRYTTQRGDRVYFSDSIHGNMNIFTSYKLLDSWSEPISISSVINTSANENYPFLLLDGVTVYYASDGEGSMGGYDLFVTRFTPSTNTYLAPENIGFPFNSTANDYMMVMDEQRKLGWFATDRNQNAGKVIIYTFVPNQAKKNIKSEDKEYLRKAAQLHTYRRTSLVSINQVATEQSKVLEQQQIEFVVNDSIVYTHQNQFKSKNGLMLWLEVSTLMDEQKKMMLQLESKRLQYSDNENNEEKSKLSKDILELESALVNISQELAKKTTQLRNDENRYFLALKTY